MDAEKIIAKGNERRYSELLLFHMNEKEIYMDDDPLPTINNSRSRSFVG